MQYSWLLACFGRQLRRLVAALMPAVPALLPSANLSTLFNREHGPLFEVSDIVSACVLSQKYTINMDSLNELFSRSTSIDDKKNTDSYGFDRSQRTLSEDSNSVFSSPRCHLCRFYHHVRAMYVWIRCFRKMKCHGICCCWVHPANQPVIARPIIRSFFGLAGSSPFFSLNIQH